MADINCKDVECPMAKNCKRALDKPEKRQKYFNKSPRWIKECNSFIQAIVSNNEKREQLSEFRTEFYNEHHV